MEFGVLVKDVTRAPAQAAIAFSFPLSKALLPPAAIRLLDSASITIAGACMTDFQTVLFNGIVQKASSELTEERIDHFALLFNLFDLAVFCSSVTI